MNLLRGIRMCSYNVKNFRELIAYKKALEFLNIINEEDSINALAFKQ